MDTGKFQEGLSWCLKLRLGNLSKTEFSKSEVEEGQGSLPEALLCFALGESGQIPRGQPIPDEAQNSAGGDHDSWGRVGWR